MKTVFSNCVPRRDVLQGDLRQDMFAARLTSVINRSADPIYGDPARFFENTYITQGLRVLLREVFGRLSGQKPDSSPFIRLETSFGGGKTHNLIVLYHLAKGAKDHLPDGLVEPDWLPDHPIPVAGIVGSDMDAANGVDHGSVRTRTLWGEIAYQLKDQAGYALVRDSDESLVAPGAQTLETLVGSEPALILIDEIGRYLRTAKAVSTPNKKSDLAAQTVAFLMSLIEMAASRPKVVLVLTLSGRGDAFADETDEVRHSLSEMRSISARQERVITPADERDIAKIVTHRLFEPFDRKAARDAATEYSQYYGVLQQQAVGLPQNCTSPDYLDEMVNSYPFHPSFLKALENKVATIPEFQRTRGALRLLARVVRRLWADQPTWVYMIHAHHMDLRDDDLLGDLTSRLQRPHFRSVVEADITNKSNGAHCDMLDRQFRSAQKPRYGRNAASAIFLHSLTQGVASGVDASEVKLAALFPGAEPQHMERALRTMLGDEKGDPGTACWFLHFDGHRYVFRTEPSLTKIIQDEMMMVGRVAAKTELDTRLLNTWKKGILKPVYFPIQPLDLDDDAREPKLAIIHYEAATAEADGTEPPELVKRLFEFSGASKGYRSYKNNVLFLVADQDQVERMIAKVQYFMGIKRITEDSQRMAEFTDDQRKKLKDLQGTADFEARVATMRAYKNLYYPDADGQLTRETVPPQDQGDPTQPTQTILKVLKALEKVLTDDSPSLPAMYVKAKAWNVGQAVISTDELRQQFARLTWLKVLLDLNQLKKTIKAGIAQGVWVYYESADQVGYGPASPPPLIQLSDDTLLYTPEEAARLGLRIKGVQTVEVCPLCGKHPCVCGDEEEQKEDQGHGPGSQPKPPFAMKADGLPNQVFQRVLDEFQDRGLAKLATLKVHSEGMGKDVAGDIRSLGLAIPQMGRGQFRLTFSFLAEYGEGPDKERVTVSFSGNWDRYRRLKAVTDPFGQEATRLNASATLDITFPGGLDVDGDEFQIMRDIFVTLGIGKVRLEATEWKAEGEA